MKKITWSPILVSFPVLILVHTLWRVYMCVWTALSSLVIIGFILMMFAILLLDRFFVMCVTTKTVWITETLLLLFLVSLFFNQCVGTL